MFEMNRTNPDLVSMFSLGRSYEGRPLYVLQVGENKLQTTEQPEETDGVCVPSGRKKKPSSEESHVDGLWSSRQGVDRTCLLPVVC